MCDFKSSVYTVRSLYRKKKASSPRTKKGFFHIIYYRVKMLEKVFSVLWMWYAVLKLPLYFCNAHSHHTHILRRMIKKQNSKYPIFFVVGEEAMFCCFDFSCFTIFCLSGKVSSKCFRFWKQCSLDFRKSVVALMHFTIVLFCWYIFEVILRLVIPIRWLTSCYIISSPCRSEFNI